MTSINFTNPRIEREKLLVMLADDDEDDRLLFSQAFDNVRNIAMALQVFETGVDLLEALEEEEELPHIIFLDLNMPIKSGMECLREIRSDRRYDDIAVAIYSTSRETRDVEETLGLGANVYIHKPNNFDKLQTVLKQVLKITWQFHLSGFSKETFFLNL